ncbi:hypothetical protein IAU59_004803 [Kwoniella sp. CBS 9459]
MSPSSDLANTILVLHHPSVNPNDLLARLIDSQDQQAGDDDNDEDERRWRIDNKYYTADVSLDVHALGRGIDDSVVSRYREVDVILYLFDEIPTAIPSTLVKLLSTPRDIALAIRVIKPKEAKEIDGTPPRVKDSPSTPAVDLESGQDGNAAADYDRDVTDLFEEIGMELVDEVHPLTEDHDERPLEPLETVRQTLMTHLWPNMVRKPVGRGLAPNPSAFSASIISSPISSSSSSSYSGLRSPSTSQFPITFSRDPTAPTGAQPSIAFPLGARDHDGLRDEAVTFPALHELRAAIHAEEFGDIDRLDQMDDRFGLADPFGSGPGEEEYARLDDWLDEDDEEYEPAPEFGSNGDVGDRQDDERVGVDGKDHEGRSFVPVESETAPVIDDGVSGRRPTSSDGPRGHERAGRGDKGDWLDSDDIKFDPVPSDLPSYFDLTTTTTTTATNTSTNNSARSSIADEDQGDPADASRARDGTSAIPTQGFEDDFDSEFTAFHSAPPALNGSRSGSNRGLEGSALSLDPTPLLLHLQNVREELAGIGDEDERRVRAGKEVQQLMASLGMDMDMDMDMGTEFDGLDLDDDGDDGLRDMSR